MRTLRRQLIRLLDQARIEQHIQTIEPRLAALLVRQFMRLLPLGEKEIGVAVRVATITHNTLHRHVLTLRCPDQAFFLDAIKGYLLKKNITPLMQQTMVASMACDDKQCQIELRPPGEHAPSNFMFIALHLSATLVREITPMVRDIEAILHTVQLSVKDFPTMRRMIDRAAHFLQKDKPEEARLLAWLNDDRYLFFGLRMEQRRLGLFRRRRITAHVAPSLENDLAGLPPATEPGVEWLNLPTTWEYLYSAANVEIVRISWRAAGRLRSCFLIGHFSRSARYTNASQVPVLRQHWQALAGTPLLRHSAFYHRELRTIFDRLPKPALLSTKGEDWLAPMRSTVDLAGHTDAVCRLLYPTVPGLPILYMAISALRFGPNTMRSLVFRIEQSMGITILGHESIGIGPHRIILAFCAPQRADGSPMQTIDEASLRRAVQDTITFWKDRAKQAILDHAEQLNVPEALAEVLEVPALYEHTFPPEQLWRDIVARAQIARDGRIHVRLLLMGRNRLEIHLLTDRTLLLGAMVNRIQAFGLTAEQETMVTLGRAGEHLNINRFVCRTGHALDEHALARLRDGLDQVFNDEADHDPINELVLAAGLRVEDVAVLITLRNHLIQLMPSAARSPLIDMMLKYPACSQSLHAWFMARHAPQHNADAEAAAHQGFLTSLEQVRTLSEDRWFRALGELVQASLRTNAMIRQPGEPVVIKIETASLSFAPEPVPWRECFVHGVRVEGVHLRAGPIARGGIRHSDRPADFRTEVLELMDTQVTKNGQIIPTGAKGGFIVRDVKDAQDVVRQYRAFIRALLSITDNLVDGRIAPPAGIRVPPEDANDPYLVVAADKGTARFSDEANGIAQQMHFWMGDAFASGGRHGYDHKALGITARGAWVCIAQHFRRLGIDAWKDPIRVVGIGDMSGDVFGNGMLLNPNIRLVAAFNHRHIFLDPDPDPQRAHEERKRLFSEAAGWDAYDASAISAGGGVFERSSKSIPISPQVRSCLNIDAEALSGEALIRAILSAPVDLLYNGGIGTYIKSSSESHEDVHDPANNAVRIDAGQLRCRVVGEGGNLGMTQKARLDYARQGGLVNTDAIDNSAGVDMSDHEVNLKLLFSSVPALRLSQKRRNALLAAIAPEVTEQCLRNNLLQSRALHAAEMDTRAHGPRYRRLVKRLHEEGWLSDEKIAQPMQDIRFDRPTLAVLLGQEKNRVHAWLNKHQFAANSRFAGQLLLEYFPPTVRRRHHEHFDHHPLADEIVHTEATNRVINELGIASVQQLQTLFDHDVGTLVEALLISAFLLDARDLMDRLWEETDDADTAAKLVQEVQEGVLQFAEELLRIMSIGEIGQELLDQVHRGFQRFRRRAGRRTGHPAMAAGLAESLRTELQTLLETAQFACTLRFAAARMSMARVLKAAACCIEIFPFTDIEQLFRSQVWGSDEVHALRRLCLRRITRLKAAAIERLLAQKGDDFQRTAHRLWSGHPCWDHVRRPVQERKPGEHDEAVRIRSLLLLNQIEALIAD